MDNQYHSVRLQKDRCRGCSNCLMHCPTEAIRVRGGRAHIIKELCIDCGACIRVCAYHAKVAETNTLDDLKAFKHNIALPAPSLFAQFQRQAHSVGQVADALLAIGFDHVYEVARAADIVTRMARRMLKKPKHPRPMISSACPAVTRLIQVRFPGLIDHIAPLRQPMEVAALLARREYARARQVKPDDIGVWFITPCAAKMTAIRNPIGQERSHADGAISMTEVYGAVLGHLSEHHHSQRPSTATPLGLKWGRAGGEAAATGHDNVLSVDGIDNVIRVLEEVELGKLSDLDFLECAACPGGCVGGPLVFDNNYVAANALRHIAEHLPPRDPQDTITAEEMNTAWLMMDSPILPNEVMRLDEDMDSAIRMLEQSEEIAERLPGYDCGSCGSPSCRTFAEDIVRGYCVEMDCIYLLKDRLRVMAQQMVDMSQTKRE